MSGRTSWESRYAERGALPVGTPADLLIRHRHLLPTIGMGLDVACGDGRNALWMARQGLTVDAVDSAFAGLRRLAAAARVERLDIRPVQADLERFPLSADRYALALKTNPLKNHRLSNSAISKEIILNFSLKDVKEKIHKKILDSKEKISYLKKI